MKTTSFLCFFLILIMSQCMLVKSQMYSTSDASNSNANGASNAYAASNSNSNAAPNSHANAAPNSNANAAAGSSAGETSSQYTSNHQTEGSLHGHRIVCLYNNMDYYSTNFTPSMLDPTLCTHINYEFAILDPKTYEITPGEPSLDLQENFYEEVVKLKERNPSLKVILSLGGWKDSTKKYSELVEDPAKIDNFILTTINFLKKRGFDGLDVAWEYPNCWQGAIGISPNDKKNFAIFLQKMRAQFNLYKFILSISVSGVDREIEAAYDVPTIARFVHYVNVMSYDMHGPWEGKTGHHSQFEEVKDDDDKSLNAKAAMKGWIDSGMPRNKLNMGIPLYGKTYTLVDPQTHGMEAPVKGPGKPGPMSKQSGFLCYSEICQFLNNGSWTEDEDAGRGYYAYSGDQWVCFDPPVMVVRKVKWTTESGFGGVLIKGCSCDDFRRQCSSLEDPLMTMIKKEMIRKLAQHTLHELTKQLLKAIMV